MKTLIQWLTRSGVIKGITIPMLALGFLGYINAFGVSNIAPDVSLDTLQGKYRLSDHRGETLILFFSFPG